ncbi:MAG: IscA/HesB family protein [Deltaproteobacteria bacterium]|nr:IscA/HesB family protein [Deltaproteobacteria bacterium]
MLTVTAKANEKITAFLKAQKEPSYIRLFLSEGGCSGPSLGMGLDEPEENDEVIKENGVNYLIDKDLLDKARPISIDFIESDRGSGFSISSSLPKGEGCSSCSGC